MSAISTVTLKEFRYKGEIVARNIQPITRPPTSDCTEYDLQVFVSEIN